MYSVSSKKVEPKQIPNRTIACKKPTTQLNAFKSLLKFRSSKNTECFEPKK
jgi:hypothetical protein